MWMKKVWYLIIAVTGNALGTALMYETGLGMTAWGSSASNVSNFFDVNIGYGFIILSIVFYTLATLIRGKFLVRELIESTVFLLSFSFLTDYFVYLMPSFVDLNIALKLLINVVGMLVLLFSIAVHIRVHIAVHPMDVFLHVVQVKMKSISKGTYLSYFLGFAIAVVFGLIGSGITDIGIGTLITLASSGLVMKYYNLWILDRWDFS